MQLVLHQSQRFKHYFFRLFNISSSTQGPNAGILRSLTESIFIRASTHCILITSYHSEYVLIKDNTGS